MNIGMNIASQLIKLPITLGLYPESEDEVIANIGAYGPYVKYKDIFASLGRKYDVLEIGLKEAIELIDIKKNKPTNKVREIGVLKRRRQKANLYKGKTGKYYFKIGIRVFQTRNVVKDGSTYYGPYMSVRLVKTLLDFFHQLYMEHSSLNLELFD